MSVKMNVVYLVVKAKENEIVVGMDENTTVSRPTFVALTSTEFDRLYDAGWLQSYKLDTVGRLYWDEAAKRYVRHNQ